MSVSNRSIVSPMPDPETEHFWQSAVKGEFLVKRCTACGRAHWFPRTLCPFCWSDRTEWEHSPGLGTIYTYTVMRRAKEPYVIAYVELDEGPRMLTNIIECNVDAVRIGQRVQVVFVPTADQGAPPVPMFRPA